MALKISIIGAGLSGTLTAIHLMKHYNAPLELTIIEKRKENFHRGIAYASHFQSQPLNVPVGKMSVYSDKPDHFYDWLVQQAYRFPELSSFTKESFISRAVFGSYLTECFEEAERRAHPSFHLVKIEEEAIDIFQQGDSIDFKIKLANGIVLHADHVVLTTGNSKPADIPILHPEFYQSTDYFGNPWEEKTFDQINETEDVLLLGTGLTMVDHCIHLYLKGHKGKIIALSRKGLLPKAHGQTQPFQLSALPNERNTLSIFSYLKKEIQRAAALGINWQSVIDAFRPHTISLWSEIDTAEKRKFLRYLGSYWEIFRHRIPVESLHILDELKQRGQLTVTAATLQDFELHQNRVWAKIKSRGKNEIATVIIDKVINCTGPETNYRKVQQPLFINLIARDYIRPNVLNIGLDTDDEGSLVDEENFISEHIFTIGGTRKGNLWETTAMREIREQAEHLAHRLSQQVQADYFMI